MHFPLTSDIISLPNTPQLYNELFGEQDRILGRENKTGEREGWSTEYLNTHTHTETFPFPLFTLLQPVTKACQFWIPQKVLHLSLSLVHASSVPYLDSYITFCKQSHCELLCRLCPAWKHPVLSGAWRLRVRYSPNSAPKIKVGEGRQYLIVPLPSGNTFF